MAAMPSSRDELNCALAAEILRKFGTVRFRAIGSSMVPAVWPGDILQVRSVDIGEIAVGDVILFWRDSSLCAHRVLRKSGASLITAGDSLPTPDFPVTQAEFLGRVVSLIRNGREVRVRANLPLPMKAVAHGLRRWNWLLRCYVRCGTVIARLRRLSPRSVACEDSGDCTVLR